MRVQLVFCDFCGISIQPDCATTSFEYAFRREGEMNHDDLAKYAHVCGECETEVLRVIQMFMDCKNKDKEGREQTRFQLGLKT